MLCRALRRRPRRSSCGLFGVAISVLQTNVEAHVEALKAKGERLAEVKARVKQRDNKDRFRLLHAKGKDDSRQARPEEPPQV